MYESVITNAIKSIDSEIDNGILKVVMEHGIIVDKEELIKALKYDRKQYDKGYKDGYKDGIKKLCDRLGFIFEHSGLVIKLLEEMEEN